MATQQEESGFACCGVGILLSIPNIKMTRRNIINIIYYCLLSLSIVLSIPNIKMKKRNKEYESDFDFSGDDEQEWLHC